MIDKSAQFADPQWQKGFTAVPNAVVHDPTLSPNAKTVWTLIASFAWKDDRCFAGQDRLQHDARMSDPTLRKALAELTERGLLEIHKRGQGKTNVYVLQPLNERIYGSEKFLNRKILGSGTQDALVPYVEEDEVKEDEVLTPLSPPTGGMTFLASANGSTGEPDGVAEVGEGVVRGIGEARRVWDAWVEATGHKKAVFDTNRQQLIRRRLKNFPVEDLIDAVRGWKKSPWHRGENPDGVVYDSIKLLLRDSEHVERFRDLERGEQSTADTPTERAIRRIREAEAREAAAIAAREAAATGGAS